MPLNPKASMSEKMHELKKTRKSTKNPSRKAAQRNGDAHEQDVAIALNAGRKGPAMGAKKKSPPKGFPAKKKGKK